MQFQDVEPADDADVAHLGDKDLLYVAAHAHALAAATPVRLLAAETRTEATVPVATTGALLATKLHAYLDRRRVAGPDKRPGDLWDIYNLPLHLGGDASADLAAANPSLARVVTTTVRDQLVAGAARAQSVLLTSNDERYQAITTEEIRHVATIAAGNSCNAASGAGAWASGLVYAKQDGVYTLIASVRNVGDGLVASQIWVDAVQARTPRAAYCAAEGNTLPDGTAVRAGAFLNLRTGQPAKDTHFKGATLARFVEGVGLTCDAPPAGFVESGLAGDAQHVPDGLYTFYKKA